MSRQARQINKNTLLSIVAVMEALLFGVQLGAPKKRQRGHVKHSFQNKCFYCNVNGHYVRECPLKHPLRSETLDHCVRCGRSTHDVENCQAEIHLNGDVLTH